MAKRKRPLRASVSQAKSGETDWYWHLKEANGRIVADGSEGYSRPSSARLALERLITRIRAREVLFEIEGGLSGFEKSRKEEIAE